LRLWWCPEQPTTLKRRARTDQLLRTAFLSAARSDATVVNLVARRVLETPGKMPSLLPAAPGAPK